MLSLSGSCWSDHSVDLPDACLCGEASLRPSPSSSCTSSNPILRRGDSADDFLRSSPSLLVVTALFSRLSISRSRMRSRVPLRIRIGGLSDTCKDRPVKSSSLSSHWRLRSKEVLRWTAVVGVEPWDDNAACEEPSTERNGTSAAVSIHSSIGSSDSRF